MSKITCLVDNAARRSTAFWAEHGLSFCVERGGARLLWDTGQSGEVLRHNLALAGLGPEHFDALALSHAHYDHTGGLAFILRERPGLPLYAHRDLLTPRFSLRDGEYRSIGMGMSPEEVSAQADLRLSAAPQEIFPGLWTSGEIVERSEPEGRSAHHFIRRGDRWLPDPYRDDMSLVLETTEGVVLLCGCCHAGLLNTLAHVRQHFGKPIQAVLGGTHLASAGETYLAHVVSVLQKHYGGMHYYLNHCTGENAFAALWKAFGAERVHAFPAGDEVSFGD
ncbi:MAG TPA: MBL fold metallo-hydrolase [Chloroflexi bacterium]|nr:MBL fold metallo-hydrolase [Chloroflexota bacterium]